MIDSSITHYTVSDLDEADLHMVVLHTCRMMAASQQFHREASSFQMDTPCRGFQVPDTLLAVASYAVVPGDHLDSRPDSTLQDNFWTFNNNQPSSWNKTSQ